MGQEPSNGPPLNVLILYDHWSVFTNTVREHLDSFARFSRHRIAYAHAAADASLELSLSGFDVVIVHYSIRLAFDWHLSPQFAWALKAFTGLKALFIQDEYDHTWQACHWIDRLDIRLVFTCVPLHYVRQIYSRVNHDRVTFQQTLTGYLPIELDSGRTVPAVSSRSIAIGYRGRALPYRYGALAREKLVIGQRMRTECEARGIRHDIEWTEDKRIYGPAWVEFIASCRATLGTESGSNVFDFDGTLSDRIAAAVKQKPGITFEEVQVTCLCGRETEAIMNQVSPRVFEAIALRTGLILFEGEYSGVVRPSEHYIALKKDFSNVDEVLALLQDDSYMDAMTDRAYRHVVASGRYTYEAFVRGIDKALLAGAGPGRSAGPGGGGWTPRVASAANPPPVPATGLRWVLRQPRRAARFAARRLGLFWAVKVARKLRGMRRLVMDDSVFSEMWRTVRQSPSLFRASGSRRRVLVELLRLALLRQCCHLGPSGLTPVWVSLQFDAAAGRVVFASHPVQDLPDEILSGAPVLAAARTAIRGCAMREIVWDFAAVAPAIGVKLGKLRKPLHYYLGPYCRIRFTVLERLTDLDPERAERILAYVAAGVYARADGCAPTATR